MKHPILGVLIATTIAGSFISGPVRADDDPAAYFEDQCLDCHHRKKKPLEDKHLTRAEWVKGLDKMLELEKLDPVPPKAFLDKMADWLAANHGPSDAAATAPAPAPADATKSQ